MRHVLKLRFIHASNSFAVRRTHISNYQMKITMMCSLMLIDLILGRPRRKWVDNIRMDLQEVGCGYMDWIGLVQDRDRWRTLVSAVMNPRVP